MLYDGWRVNTLLGISCVMMSLSISQNSTGVNLSILAVKSMQRYEVVQAPKSFKLNKQLQNKSKRCDLGITSLLSKMFLRSRLLCHALTITPSKKEILKIKTGERTVRHSS